MEKKIKSWCIKCRAKVEMKNPQLITMKNGRPSCRGECSVCGAPLYRMGVSEKMIKNSRR